MVHFKDRSSRRPIYVYDKLYFLKGSYTIRITQWSRQIIHRKRLFKELNMLLQERLTFLKTMFDRPTKRKLFPDQSRYAENIVGPDWFLPVRSDIFRYVCFTLLVLFCWFLFFLNPFPNRVRVMVFNATFNNISAISWQSVLLVEETVVPRENHWPAARHWQTL